MWIKLYKAAQKILSPRQISPFINVGAVAWALLTTQENIYTGICIDTACSLGMCAERNAIANMITNGEHQILQLLCIDSNNMIVPPCGANLAHYSSTGFNEPSSE
ncbi:MAG: hypothetical protein H0U27_06035 [Nitrosopumilus sp.]|nr:hypothetical protein [Nitrosopumilus sp.]